MNVGRLKRVILLVALVLVCVALILVAYYFSSTPSSLRRVDMTVDPDVVFLNLPYPSEFRVTLDSVIVDVASVRLEGISSLDAQVLDEVTVFTFDGYSVYTLVATRFYHLQIASSSVSVTLTGLFLDGAMFYATGIITVRSEP